MIHRTEIASPLGPLTLVASDEALLELRFAPCPDRSEAPVLARACRELEQYFAGARTRFELPLAPRGSDLDREVWSELRAVPYGETTTYGELARRLGRPTAARAVAGANARNPIALVIPCHRVIGKGGELRGYRWGLERKARLLGLEATGRSSGSP